MNYFEKISKLPIKENPIIMGLETSCDETAVAIIKDGNLVVQGLMEEVTKNKDLEEVFLELNNA